MVPNTERGQSVIEFLMFTIAIAGFVFGIAALGVQATQTQKSFRFTEKRSLR